MFKSIRWKITVIFVLLVLATELFIGGFNILGVMKHYHDDFSNSINEVFTEDIKNDLLAAANEISIPAESTDTSIVIEENSQSNINLINNILSSHSGKLGITSSRYYNIVDGSSGEILFSSNGSTTTDATPSLMNALNGTESKETKLTQSYMDYAFPLHNGDAVKYVIYIKDTCQMQNSVTHSMVTILLILLLVSLIISSIAGSIISKSITDPIKQLSVQAKKLAAGDINALQKSDSKDEIADLTNSLINLAHTRKQSSDQAKGEKIKVETILQNMNDGIIAFDLKGNLIHFNREAKKLLNRQYLDDIRFDRFFCRT